MHLCTHADGGQGKRKLVGAVLEFQNFVFTFDLLGKEEEELKGIALGLNIIRNKVTSRCIVTGTCILILSIQGAGFLIIHLLTDRFWYCKTVFS